MRHWKLYAAVPAAIGVVALMVGVVLFALGSPASATLFVAVGAFEVATALNFARTRVIVDGRSITVVNRYRSHDLRRTDVRGVQARQRLGSWAGPWLVTERRRIRLSCCQAQAWRGLGWGGLAVPDAVLLARLLDVPVVD